MQVTETLSEGLKRSYDVVIPASDLASKLDSELNDLKTKVRINGFRPGKVPMAHLRRVYGRSVMADLVQKQIDAANKEIIEGHNLRLAMQPRIELSKEQTEIEAALEAKGDLAFKIELEVLPQFELGDFRRYRAGAPGRRRRRGGDRALRAARRRQPAQFRRAPRGRGAPRAATS